MANRIIRESALTSPSLDQLTDGAERLWWRLTVVADDYGRFAADPRIVLAKCFPLKVRHLTTSRIRAWIAELEAIGGIRLYTENERTYGYFVKWSLYQRSFRAKSLFPAPPQIAADCGSSPQVAADCGSLPPVLQSTRVLDDREEMTENRLTPPVSPPKAGDLVDLWNAILPHPPFATITATAKRLEQAKRRLAECPDLEFWTMVLQRASGSPFLRGAGNRGWVMNFDWLVRNDTNAHKVAEGKFDQQTMADRVRAEMISDLAKGAENGQGGVPGGHGFSGRSIRATLLPDDP